MEALDPDISHFEFFLARAPVPERPADNGSVLLTLAGERNRCLWGWPSATLLGPDLEPLSLEDGDVLLLQALESAPAGTPMGQLDLEMGSEERLTRIRRLRDLSLLLLVTT